MEKQHKLVTEVLQRLSREGILQQVLLIGSWCAYFYKDYFKGTDYHPVLRTRDIDFLISERPHFQKNVDLSNLLGDLGFEIEFYGKGYMRLESPDLFLELMVPEVGRPREKPYPLPQLKFNAQPLRHLSMLWRDPIQVHCSNISIQLPHPADFCLHKLIISGERKTEDKRIRDYELALLVLETLLQKGKSMYLSNAFHPLTVKEKKSVLKILEKSKYAEWASRL